MDGVSNVIDAAKEISVVHAFRVLLGQLVQQRESATAAHIILAFHPVASELKGKRRLCQRRVTGCEHVRQHATFETLHLLLCLFPRKLFRIVDQQTEDLCIVDVGFPKRLSKRVVPTDLLGHFAQLGQADAKAL